MTQPIDEHFTKSVAGLRGGSAVPLSRGEPAADLSLALFDAQVQARHLDFAARWLQARGEGFYTIGSAGHEANAALGLVTRVDDPALLHYRSGGFYAARAAKHAAEVPVAERGAGADPVRDVLLGLTAAADDPISGGRHKVFGHPDLHIIPQTSTIGSHLPRAVGLGYALGSLRDLASRPPWKSDAIVLATFGDASVNHSTTQGALNAAGYLSHRRVPVPVLFVCEDNGLGISTPTPAGWMECRLQHLPGVAYFEAFDAGPGRLLADVEAAVAFVRTRRHPAVLHLRTVRFGGHAGSDAEVAYRSSAEIAADYERDPLLASAAHLVGGGLLTPAQVVGRYEAARRRVMAGAEAVLGRPRLADRAAVMSPLVSPRRVVPSGRPGSAGETPSPAHDGDRTGDAGQRLTLAQALNAALAEVLGRHPQAVLFGEDVAAKGGVYGVTRGLRKRFGRRRVFDTLLDEQTILGTALGAGLAGLLPIPEIQYLAYLHNAEDQLRGEGASLQFFSQGHYRNPMVVRVAGLAYQKGFGGHFHNDNSVAVLRDIPGLVLCVPSHPGDAAPLLRECVDLALVEGRVCVVLEPIALYHTKDLFEDGDGLWLSARASGLQAAGPGVRRHRQGRDVLVVTFGNGLPMSLRAARRLEAEGIGAAVVDLRWLAPLPVDSLLAEVRDAGRVLVADETRRSGGVAEAVVAAVVDSGFSGPVARVTSHDSYLPLGPAAQHVLLQEQDIVHAAQALVQRPAALTGAKFTSSLAEQSPRDGSS